MTALRLPLLAVAAVALSGAGSARGAVSRWPDTLAAALAHLDNPDSVSLPNQLGPAISFAAGPCRTANLPSGDSDAPVAAAVLVYADETSCQAPTPLVMLQLYIEAQSVGDVDRLKNKLANMLPAPCFSGHQPSDPRRRAPPHELVAWKLDGRWLSLGQDVGRGSAVGVSFVRTKAEPMATDKQKQGEKALVDTFVASLPAVCR